MQSKWSNISHTAKTSNDEGGDPVGGGLELATRVVSLRGRRWENDEEKRECVEAQMTDKFRDIMAREEASAKHNEFMDKKKVKRFDMFVKIQKKMIELEERKFAIKFVCEGKTNLYLKANNLDPDLVMFIHDLRDSMYVRFARKRKKTQEIEAFGSNNRLFCF